MAILSHIDTAFAHGDITEVRAKQKPSLWKRMVNNMLAARQAKANDVAHYYLKKYDDETLKQWGFSTTEIKEIRSNKSAKNIPF